MGLRDRINHAWNALTNKDPTSHSYVYGSSNRPDRIRLSGGVEKSIVTSIYNRIAIDGSNINIKHVRLDDQDRFKEVIPSGLNRCLTVEANIDQTGRTFMHDVILSLFDEGVVAIVPVDTSMNPNILGSWDVKTLRVGSICEWFPEHVRIKLYNEKTGFKEDITLPKKIVGIVENPFYSVMNEPNSIGNRLINKLNLLDTVDDKTLSGKLDMIIQLPYTTKSSTRREQAAARTADLESQLRGSTYGIGYIDATEKIHQLNRPVDNNLLQQIQMLTKMLFDQLCITDGILNGTADEATMLNYNTRTVIPVMKVICDELTRKFLTKTAQSQKQTLQLFTNPFQFVPVSSLADMADKLTRNEILTSNEVRGIIGFNPSVQDGADELRNKNLNRSDNEPATESKEEVSLDEKSK